MNSQNLKIVNVIASTRVNGPIDIESLSQKLEQTQYNPELFPGLVYRPLCKPSITMFASGKITSQGAKSEKEAKEAIVQILNELVCSGDLKNSQLLEDIKIENVVGTANIGNKIDLNNIFNKNEAICKKSSFPGLIVRPDKISATCLLFSNGKIVIVGAKSEQQIGEAFERIKSLIGKLS